MSHRPSAKKPEVTHLHSPQASSPVFVLRGQKGISSRSWAPLRGGALESNGIFDGIWGPLEPPVGAGQPAFAVVPEEGYGGIWWCGTLLLAWI